MDPNHDDAAIAEFHAAAKRRRRLIMAVTAVLCAAIGIAILIVTFTAGEGSEEGGGKMETRTLAVGGAFVLAGFVSAGMAIKGD